MSRRMRINQRLLVLVIVAVAPLLWFGYVLASQMIYRGIVPHEGYSTVDLKTLGFFTFDPNHPTLDQVPNRFRQLDGKRIELSGFMYSATSAGGRISDCELVYNIQICCFQGPPQVQERVFVRCGKGKTMAYEDGMVNVIGTLHVNIETDRKTGIATAVYVLDVERVDPT